MEWLLLGAAVVAVMAYRASKRVKKKNSKEVHFRSTVEIPVEHKIPLKAQPAPNLSERRKRLIRNRYPQQAQEALTKPPVPLMQRLNLLVQGITLIQFTLGLVSGNNNRSKHLVPDKFKEQVARINGSCPAKPYRSAESQSPQGCSISVLN